MWRRNENNESRDRSQNSISEFPLMRETQCTTIESNRGANLRSHRYYKPAASAFAVPTVDGTARGGLNAKQEQYVYAYTRVVINLEFMIV